MAPKQNKIQLIELVRDCSFLFDRLNEDNRNKPKVDAKWAEIAEICGYDDGDDARSTWQNVVKARNRWKVAAANGSDAKTYVYEENLRFLDAYYPYKQLGQQQISESPSSSSYNQELINLLAFQNGDYRMDEDGMSGFSGSGEQQQLRNDFAEPEYKRPKLSHENGTNPKPPSNGQIVPKSETMGEVFSKTVAVALNQLKGKRQMQAQVEIMEVLLKYAED